MLFPFSYFNSSAKAGKLPVNMSSRTNLITQMVLSVVVLNYGTLLSKGAN